MEKMIRLSGIERDSIVDGPGFRMTLFTQGCPHHCEGCHNPQTHDFAGGYEESPERILEMLRKNPMERGVTLSGGEPFCQAEALLPLAREIRALGRDIWAYSGYTFEELTGAAAPAFARELLELCDVLVDGKFILAKRDIGLQFRGSSNQRVIRVPASFAAGEVVLYPVTDEI
jgi:anaerobic ribonucleoside-triphosphate reductase activating protein